MSEQTIFFSMIFIIALLMSQAFVAPMMGSSARARRRLRGRIHELSSDAVSQQHVSLVRQKYLKKLSPLEQRLEALPGMTALRALIEQSGAEHVAYRVVLFAVGTGAAAALLVGLWRGSAVEAGLAGLAAFAFPFVVLRRRRTKRLARFEEQLPDALSVMARSLQAGLPFTEALHMVGEEMDEPVSTEFDVVFRELNYGGDVRTALLGLLQRMPTIAVTAMVSSIFIQRETGGNLAEVLDRIGQLLRQRFRFQRSIRTLTAEGRMTAYVATAMPFLLGAAMEFVTPGWMASLSFSKTLACLDASINSCRADCRLTCISATFFIR